MTFLDEQQIKSIQRALPAALNYHFGNFQGLEKIASPEPDDQRMKELAERIKYAKALTNITFEVQAYLNQLRHIYYFLNSSQIKTRNIALPPKPELRDVYDSIVNKNGMVYMLTQKWSAHRSYDYPWKGDDERLHREVILNLSGGVTMWLDGHCLISLKNHTLDLCSFHPKVIDFLDWLFQELS
jgi:hypothetical protein